MLTPSPISAGYFEKSGSGILVEQIASTSPSTPYQVDSKIVRSVSSDTSSSRGVKDIVWLLETLRYDGGASRDEKKKAIAELKRLAKMASEDYWKRNCSQVTIFIYFFIYFFNFFYYKNEIFKYKYL